MIEFAELTKTYAETTVLGPVTGEFPRGGVTALVGPNGAGKSTLLTILGRLLDATSGEATLDGRPIRSYKSTELARRLAILRQENSVNARLSVRDLVAFGRFPHSRGRLTAETTRRSPRPSPSSGSTRSRTGSSTNCPAVSGSAPMWR